jgi:hypothetical protein
VNLPRDQSLRRRQTVGAPLLLALVHALAFLPSLASAEDFPLPSAMTDSAVWDAEDFREGWLPRQSNTRISHRIWPQQRTKLGKPLPYPEIFGLRPQVISARFVDDEIRSLTLLFLDSGTHFGYVPREKAVQTANTHRENFHQIYADADSRVRAGLNQLAKGRGKPVELGSESMLKQEVEIFSTGNLFARLHSLADQLVKVTFFRNSADAESWISRELRAIEPRDRAAGLENNITAVEDDVLLNEIPLFPQGDRAYCGVSALSMAMQYLGLEIDTEDYAAAAGIRYGSTRGSKIREIYSAAADELGYDLRRQTKFDFSRTQKALDAGLPVIVWRRWSQGRDYLHTQFAKRRAKDSTINLPIADAKDRIQWPQEDAYNHASVITGYNARRGEVIFTESWGEAVRTRRMRIAEMEATCYYTFYFSP